MREPVNNIDDQVKLYLGDCLEVLKEMDDNSVDSIVTDPPAGISFMGKDWDRDKGGRQQWISWMNDVATECIRVIKPGGHALVWSIPRTSHWTGMAWEDAGWTPRDKIYHVFGCYSADTEVLTMEGWKSFWEVKETDKLLQWEKTSNSLSWEKPIDSFEYDVSDEMVLLENRHTSQLVTKDHTVYAKVNDDNEFSSYKAGELKKSWAVSLPLSAELKEGKSVPDPYLVGWWLTDAWRHLDGKACMFSQSKTITLNKLREYFDDNNVKYSEYTKPSKKETHNVEHTFYVTGEKADYLIKQYPNRELTWEVLSWNWDSRYNLLEGILDGDGSRRRNGGYSEVFWSRKAERLDIVQALCLSLNIRNHIDYQKGCVHLNRTKSSTQLQSRHKKPFQKYQGKVWCFQTQTGAFVVRRNGKAFISGNSGFPKSQNISKAIDKAAGAERGSEYVPNGKNNTHGKGWGGGEHNAPSDPPATPEAQQWDGWGTALKPASEEWWLFRKPISESTIANNVLKWGTGAINVDGCRMGTEEELGRNNNTNPYGSARTWSVSKTPPQNNVGTAPQGRWPANFIHDGSDEVVGLFPVTTSGGGNRNGAQKGEVFHGVGDTGTDRPFPESTGSAARFFYQAKASKQDREEGLDAFDDKKAAGLPMRSADGKRGGEGLDGTKTDRETVRKNSHPTVKATSLMRYLVRLVTPPNGIVLDPFMGSGSTGKGAVLEGFKFIGIDSEPEYVEISRARIDYALKNGATYKESSSKKKEKKNEPKDSTLF